MPTSAAAEAILKCTLATCPISLSPYPYRVSRAANATFTAIFAVSFIAFVAVFAATRRAYAFSIAMACGTFLEILGYAGRIMSWANPWSQEGFLMQTVCLTMAPAFMAGGIYMCLRRIVYALGPENSRISPEMYTRIFIPCDVVSLVLQAIGGGYACMLLKQSEDPQAGKYIMVAGLASQVLTLILFIVFCIDFIFRARRNYEAYGPSTEEESAHFAALKGDRRFQLFLASLALATLLIFWRSVYRVAELSDGWSGPLMAREGMFIGFEGVLIVVSMLLLNVFHPAICFKEGVAGAGSLRSLKMGSLRRRKVTKEMVGSKWMVLN